MRLICKVIVFLSGLLSLFSMPARSATLDRYLLGKGQQAIRVEVSTPFGQEQARISWQRGKQLQQQKLTFPLHWRPTTRSSNSGLPGVLLWKPTVGSSLLVLIARQDEYGIWEYRSPALFRLAGRTWKLLNPNLWTYAFSNAGSFSLQGQQLLMWDIAYNPERAHHDVHPFRLHRFRWQKGHLQSAGTQTTRKHYEWRTLDEHLQHRKKLATPDPLRELGLKWRWWSTTPT